jgi:hypothetical protein
VLPLDEVVVGSSLEASVRPPKIISKGLSGPVWEVEPSDARRWLRPAALASTLLLISIMKICSFALPARYEPTRATS